MHVSYLRRQASLKAVWRTLGRKTDDSNQSTRNQASLCVIVAAALAPPSHQSGDSAVTGGDGKVGATLTEATSRPKSALCGRFLEAFLLASWVSTCVSTTASRKRIGTFRRRLTDLTATARRNTSGGRLERHARNEDSGASLHQFITLNSPARKNGATLTILQVIAPRDIV